MEPPPEHGGTHAIAARRYKQRMRPGSGVTALCLSEQHRPPLLNIETSHLERTTIQGDDTFFAPLAPQTQRAFGPSDGLHIECCELRDTGARCIEQLEHCRIAQSRGRRGIRRLEQCLDLLSRKDARQVARQLGRCDSRDRITLDNPLGSHPPIERANGRQMRRKRSGSHLLTRKLGKIATNGAHVGSESIDILALAPGSKALQSRAIGSHRVGRKSLDTCDIGDKRVDGVVQVKGYDRSPPNRSGRVAR